MMPRPSEDKARIEAARLQILHEIQQEKAQRIKKAVRVKKAGRLPGELNWKKTIAVYMKVANPKMSFIEIANSIDEYKSEVRRWFRHDPEVIEMYQYALQHLKESGLEYLETLQFEAIETLSTLMRHGSEKYMFDAATDILDRVGIAKVSKQQINTENVKSHKWEDRERLVEEIRALTPEQQEEAADLLEGLEKLLSGEEVPQAEEEEEFESGEIDGDD